ncbi:hypothetical protein KIN20_016165 [Parelaphostrongylus tenuis]|uniref:Uncharacterized protein n=1 Tax=Parelaphostrongylus tenuis TaxID=148309 RepID=A0AAD5N130_PARTN|nr:hypothetical protein KIN20_016165 [Parelaphostrongylus tenuis]
MEDDWKARKRHLDKYPLNFRNFSTNPAGPPFVLYKHRLDAKQITVESCYARPLFQFYAQAQVTLILNRNTYGKAINFMMISYNWVIVGPLFILN